MMESRGSRWQLLLFSSLASFLATPALAQTAAPVQPGALPPQHLAAANAVHLTLGDSVDKALATAPRLRAAEADLQAQVEEKHGSWSDVGPRVTLNWNQAHFPDGPITADFPMGPNGATVPVLIRPTVNTTGSVQIAQPITGAWALTEKARFESSQEDLKDWTLKLTRSDVAFGASEAWLSAYAAQRLVDIADAAIVAAQDQLHDAQALERAGRLNHGDTLKLDLNLSEARAQAAQARAARDTAFAALREAVGLPVDTPLQLDGALPEVAPPPSDQEAVKTALENRPELKQADAGVEAAHFGKKLAYTNFVPTVNAFAELDHTYGELSALGGERNTKSYGINATWTVWNNGSHVFAVREAVQNEIKADETKQGAAQSVRLDVLRALANFRAAQESLELAKVAVDQASEALRIEQARFKTGTRSATDLVLAETSKTSAQGRFVSAQTDLIRWHLRTQKALGGELPKL